jgi:ribosomal-protein-alanine N-acetyltransferase
MDSRNEHREPSFDNLCFREGEPQDLPGVRAILQENGLQPTSPATTGDDAVRVRTYVCQSHGALVAVLQWRQIGPEAELLDIAVPAKLRRKGFATRLLSEWIRIAQACGVLAIFLEVRESNLPASRLYGALGFATIGKRAAYYSNPSEAALLMRLEIPG